MEVDEEMEEVDEEEETGAWRRRIWTRMRMRRWEPGGGGDGGG